MALAAAGGPGKGAKADAGSGAASIHDRVQVKEAGLAARLVYDDYERRSGLLRILRADATAVSWGAGGRDELGDFAIGQFRIVQLGDEEVIVAREGSATVDGALVPLAVETRVRLAGGRLDPALEWSTTIRNRGDRPVTCRVGSEWAITMLGGGGNPDAWWEIAGERARHDGSGAAANVERLAQGNSWLGVEVETSVTPAADAWHAPIETVSNSEAGFERVYQGSALLISWPVTLSPGKSFTATVRHQAKVAVDRSLLEEHA
jgi:alpha-amylase